MEKSELKRTWPPDLPYDNQGMTLEKALTIIDASTKRSIELDFPMALAVCDAGGNLVALHKMDDAALLSLELSQNKAKTAVLGKIPTLMWADSFIGDTAHLPTLFFHSNWITFMGGFPIILDNKIIGGFGCSGATWEDGLIAKAGLAAVGADLSGVDACLEKSRCP